MKTDFDGAWKRALKKFLPQSFQLLFPDAHARIDWARGAMFLDKELERAARDTKFPKLRVDKLIRVYLKGGGELWMLIHIEVQSQQDKHFALRMCVYNCRIFDLYAASPWRVSPFWPTTAFRGDRIATRVAHPSGVGRDSDKKSPRPETILLHKFGTITDPRVVNETNGSYRSYGSYGSKRRICHARVNRTKAHAF